MHLLIVAATGDEKFPVTLDLRTTYFKPIPIGPRVLVEARIDRIGGSAAFTTRTSPMAGSRHSNRDVAHAGVQVVLV